MRTDSDSPESKNHYLLVRSGGHRCAIPVEATKLVANAPQVFPLPKSAPRLLGLAQVAGEPVAVVDLHALLDLDGNQGGRHELTVIIRPAGRGSSLGLSVDEAFGVIEITHRAERATDDPGWVAGRISLDNRTVFILDPEELFAPPGKVREGIG